MFTLSKELNVQSPVEKLILVPKATGEFGWEGSTGFLLAAAKSKKHSSVAPKFYTKGAVKQIICEIEEAAEGTEGMRSTNYNAIVSRIESSALIFQEDDTHETTLMPTSSSSSTVFAPIPTSSTVFSPIPSEKIYRSHSKSNSNHSNKGVANKSHKLDQSKMGISVKVTSSLRHSQYSNPPLTLSISLFFSIYDISYLNQGKNQFTIYFLY